MMFCPGWYLIYTRHRREKKVADQLIEKEVDFYLPTVKTFRKWHDRNTIVDVPIFPSYIFVFLKHMNDYYKVTSVEGVMHFVKSGKEIVTVNKNIITDLKQVLGTSKEVEVVYENFVPGVLMNIREGPLAGMSCEIVEYKNQRKILVRINLLGRAVLADVPANHLIEALGRQL